MPQPIKIHSSGANHLQSSRMPLNRNSLTICSPYNISFERMRKSLTPNLVHIKIEQSLYTRLVDVWPQKHSGSEKYSDCTDLFYNLSNIRNDTSTKNKLSSFPFRYRISHQPRNPRHGYKLTHVAFYRPDDEVYCLVKVELYHQIPF